MTASAHRLLFAEDNPDDALLIQTVIARSGRNVALEIVENGRDALELLLPPARAPQITFLDVNLPLLSGLDVLAAVRAARIEPSPVLIVMTSSTAPRDEQRAIALGCTEFHVKPIRISHFRSIIDGVLARWLPAQRPAAGDSGIP